MGIRDAFRKANKTVNEVEQWGRDSAAYREEQAVKRGEKPYPATEQPAKERK